MTEYEIYYDSSHITSCEVHELDNTLSIVENTLDSVLADYNKELVTVEISNY